MNAPLIRTLEQAESFDRAERAAERRRLILLGVRCGWISFPTNIDQAGDHQDAPTVTAGPNKPRRNGRKHEIGV